MKLTNKLMALFHRGEVKSSIELDPQKMPRHIAIIMDGNGRWAKSKGMMRTLGHRAGVEALREIIRKCDALSLEALSIYAFSTENWKRPKAEISGLMALLVEFFNSEIDELHEKGVAIRILGDRSALPKAAQDAVTLAEDKTANNLGLKLNIALNYGSRDEIIRAAKCIAADVKSGALSLDDIDDTLFQKKLYTHDLPDIDLLIRTSGEQRISNFMLYQAAYAEFIFVETLWPEFSADELVKTIKVFQSRHRRFGGLN